MARPAVDPEKRASFDVEQIYTLAREGMPKTYIAAYCGVSRGTIHDWLTGVTTPPEPDFAVKFLRAEAEYVREALRGARADKRGEQWLLERRCPKEFRPEAALGALAHESNRDDAETAVADLLAKAREEWERERKAGLS